MNEKLADRLTGPAYRSIRAGELLELKPSGSVAGYTVSRQLVRGCIKSFGNGGFE